MTLTRLGLCTDLIAATGMHLIRNGRHIRTDTCCAMQRVNHAYSRIIQRRPGGAAHVLVAHAAVRSMKYSNADLVCTQLQSSRKGSR
jgi:hypothetical protein